MAIPGFVFASLRVTSWIVRPDEKWKPIHDITRMKNENWEMEDEFWASRGIKAPVALLPAIILPIHPASFHRTCDSARAICFRWSRTGAETFCWLASRRLPAQPACAAQCWWRRTGALQQRRGIRDAFWTWWCSFLRAPARTMAGSFEGPVLSVST